MGRIERSFLSDLTGFLDPLFLKSFSANLTAALQTHEICCAHLIPHSFEFAATWDVCRKLHLPVVLNVHDDLDYNLSNHPFKDVALEALGNAWRESESILAISDEIAMEYNRRFGERSYTLVTDGIRRISHRPRLSDDRELTVYFMGLAHVNYSNNFLVLIEALERLQKHNRNRKVKLVCRCGVLPFDLPRAEIEIEVLPFAPESAVENDMDNAHILYQPLSFEEEAAAFGKFSLSTKMISYLGSGRPILYHGPSETAAHNLLSRHQAAAICSTRDASDLANVIHAAILNEATMLANARELAEQSFLLEEQQHRFWQAIHSVMQ